ncbi:hypothetical protein PAXRUDRAFT_21508 [Paxillus rubicundulus Ve08.2h10]|uniref:Uncharacterized protein n=1 Tax=Paxillus rubicundulus Ve08.2h10 TaxID=930991 RepID=A0A0D0D7D8_9AGAM|nr:hypothetical protein PAXRUDRAFT_21508 [Paxillus rubicundulus Ve08.2h10]
MAVIAINKILAIYLPGAKVPSVVITAEMQMFPIDQVSTHIWAQVPKSILKGKGVDPLERGGAMEAGGSKVEGKKKEKKIERLSKESNGGQDSGAVGLELGGPIAGGDLGAGTAKETRG